MSLKTLIKNLGNLENTSRQLFSTSPLLSFVIFPVLTFIPPSLFVCVHLHFHSHRPTRLPQGLKINLTVLKIINLVEAEGLPVTCTVAHVLTPYFYLHPTSLIVSDWQPSQDLFCFLFILIFTQAAIISFGVQFFCHIVHINDCIVSCTTSLVEWQLAKALALYHRELY